MEQITTPRRICRTASACWALVTVVASASFAAPAAGAQAVLPTARLVKELVIDGRDEDWAVLNGAKVNARGDIAMGFRQDAQVRVYDAKGKRVAVAGRKGSGPGEFRFITVRGWIGETVWIHDLELQRHTFVSREGKVLRSEPMETTRPAPLSSAGRLVSVVGPITPHARRADGAMFAIAQVARAGSEKQGRSSIVSISPTGSVTFVAAMDDVRSSPWEMQFSPWPVVAFSSDGLAAAQVRVNNMVREGGTYTVTRFAANGDTLVSRTFPYRSIPMSARYRDSVLARGVGFDGVKAAPASRIPPVLVPVSGMTLGPDGQAFITLRDTESGHVVRILNVQGTPIAQFPVLPQSYLMAATSTQVWLVQADGDGMQSVVRYGISCSRKPCR